MVNPVEPKRRSQHWRWIPRPRNLIQDWVRIPGSSKRKESWAGYPHLTCRRNGHSFLIKGYIAGDNFRITNPWDWPSGKERTVHGYEISSIRITSKILDWWILWWMAGDSSQINHYLMRERHNRCILECRSITSPEPALRPNQPGTLLFVHLLGSSSKY